jgi:hypothetical protein
MSTASIREIFLQKMSVLPADYYPKVLRYIETLDEVDHDCENWSEAEWEEWLSNNPPIPIEEDPTISPEHLARLRQRSKDMDEGKTPVIPFSEEEWKEFCQEMEHSPETALAKAESRRCYLTPKQA